MFYIIKSCQGLFSVHAEFIETPSFLSLRDGPGRCIDRPVSRPHAWLASSVTLQCYRVVVLRGSSRDGLRMQLLPALLLLPSKKWRGGHSGVLIVNTGGNS